MGGCRIQGTPQVQGRVTMINAGEIDALVFYCSATEYCRS